MSRPIVSFDNVLDRVGGSGRWQVLLFILTSSSGFFFALHGLASIFLANIPDHWCSIPNANNESVWGSNWTLNLIKEYAIPRETDGTYSKCSIYRRNYTAPAVFQDSFGPNLAEALNDLTKEGCNSYSYDYATFQDTVVTEWNLVCDNKVLASLAQSMFMIGVLIGTFTYGLISDRFGRRIATLISVVEFAVCPILGSISIHYIWFLVFRMLTGMGGGGIFSSNFVLMAEWIHPSVRDIVGIAFQIPFGVGYVVLTGLAYEIRTWSKLQLVMGIANAALFIYFWLLPESPRWLIMNSRIQEALPILRTAAKYNGKKVTDSELTVLMEAYAKAEAEKRIANNRQPSSISILVDLFRTTQMRKRILVSYFIWLSVSMCYYGLSLNAPKLGNDIYLVTLLSALTEIPSYIVGCCTIRLLPRKFNVIGTFIIGGVSCLLILIVPKGETAVIMGLALCGKFFINITFSIVYLYATEIFPTGNRNVALGTSSMCARVGAAISPFITDLLGGIIPLVVFGVASCMSGILCVLLPETKDKALPESVRDVEMTSTLPRNNDAERPADEILHM